MDQIASDQIAKDRTRVTYIFNEMRDEYDELRDLWYAWLASRLHYLIAKHVLANWDTSPRTVLDVGCGTGFQSFLYALTGAEVIGVDISDQLILVAEEKVGTFSKRFPCPLFPAYFDFVKRYDRLIGRILAARFATTDLIRPAFRVVDARDLPFKGETFDHVNCCGSTLSFIGEHDRALAEISRVLKPGGTFILEVEAKYNLDILWTAIDTFCFGRLHYDTPLQDAVKALFSRPRIHITVEYPFGDERNPVYMPIKLFAKAQLVKELKIVGLRVTKTLSIHSVTNVIPSTLLDSPNPGALLKGLFLFLAGIEERLPFCLPGCSLLLIGTKARGDHTGAAEPKSR